MTTLTPTQTRMAREACACPDCGAVIWRGSARCMPCHHKARKAASARTRPAPRGDDGGPYLRITVPPMTDSETHGEGGDPYRGETLTWACWSPDAADAMEAIFAGRTAGLRSRDAFAPMPWHGLAERMAAEAGA